MRLIKKQYPGMMVVDQFQDRYGSYAKILNQPFRCVLVGRATRPTVEGVVSTQKHVVDYAKKHNRVILLAYWPGIDPYFYMFDPREIIKCSIEENERLEDDYYNYPMSLGKRWKLDV